MALKALRGSHPAERGQSLWKSKISVAMILIENIDACCMESAAWTKIPQFCSPQMALLLEWAIAITGWVGGGRALAEELEGPFWARLPSMRPAGGGITTVMLVPYLSNCHDSARSLWMEPAATLRHMQDIGCQSCHEESIISSIFGIYAHVFINLCVI